MRNRAGQGRAWDWAPLAAFLSLGLPACQSRTLVDGLPAELGCSSCHGNESNPAPPYAVNGAISTSAIGVGAHQPHVTEGPISGAYGCDECHPLPLAMDGDSHPDPLARGTRMLFGPTASTGGATPAWDRKSRTCSNTYCHGATLSGKKIPAAPVWTRVDGSQSKCDSCHADEPEGLGAGHPLHQDLPCSTCHPQVVSSDKKIRAPALHVDGMVEVHMETGTWDRPTRSCADTSDACHGQGSLPW